MEREIFGDTITCDGKISYIQYFTLYPEKESAEKIAGLKDQIRQEYPSCHFQDEEELTPILQDFQTVQQFLHGGGLPFECWRALLCDVPVSMELANVQRLQIMCSVFPEINIGKMTFNLQYSDIPVSQMVYLHHCNSNGARITFPNGEKYSISEMLTHFISRMHLSGAHHQSAHLIEINRFGTVDLLADVMANHKKALYGIISGDEGWNHIPQSLAEERIHCDWSSRNYVSFTVFGTNFLLMNLIHSSEAVKYRENQLAFGSEYYGGMNPYFALNPAIAGVNHGIIFSVELVMAIKTISSRILQIQEGFQKGRSGNFRHDINQTKDYRRELITTLNRVEHIDMTELGELEQIILNSQQITPIIDKIKYLLELLESELNLMYQTRTNTIVNILTIIGLVIAFLQLIR